MKDRIYVGVSIADVLKALGDPVRWSIVEQVSVAGELPHADLEATLPVSKPTVSYHTRLLAQAGLLVARKQGRHFYYTLNNDVIREVLGVLYGLAEPSDPMNGPAGRDAADRSRAQ